MRTPIVFWGATGQAKVLNEFIGQLGYRLVALFDNNPSVDAGPRGAPVHVGLEGFRRWRASHPGPASFVVAIGGARGRDRIEIHDFLSEQGLVPAQAIHPSSYVAVGASLAAGAQVMANATVCADAAIGRCAIINTASSVDHECTLGDGVHVAPGCTLAGCVSVGECTMIGAGAVVLPGVHVGRDTVVGAGSVVTRDIPDGVVAYGNPARTMRHNELGTGIPRP